jgi:hypothetical protein
MGRRERVFEIDEDSLDLLDSEIEDLENDEISSKEAGFMQGYEDACD